MCCMADQAINKGVRCSLQIHIHTYSVKRFISQCQSHLTWLLSSFDFGGWKYFAFIHHSAYTLQCSMQSCNINMKYHYESGNFVEPKAIMRVECHSLSFGRIRETKQWSPSFRTPIVGKWYFMLIYHHYSQSSMLSPFASFTDLSIFGVFFSLVVRFFEWKMPCCSYILLVCAICIFNLPAIPAQFREKRFVLHNISFTTKTRTINLMWICYLILHFFICYLIRFNCSPVVIHWYLRSWQTIKFNFFL